MMKRAPVAAIKKLAGHARLRTTMRYMHLNQGAVTDAIGLLDEAPSDPAEEKYWRSEQASSVTPMSTIG